ncbi:MAG: hypothetical protein LRZ92_05665 [Methanosarcinaceae archaeon]|nr:hypothetical protein [Methanosarcinaceae archaeon]
MIQYILLRVTAHSTEKISRVEKTLGFFLLPNIFSTKEFFKDSLNQTVSTPKEVETDTENPFKDISNERKENYINETNYLELIDKTLKNKIELISIIGHYKNPITIISVKLTRKSEISSFFKCINENISFSEHEKFISDIPDRLDEDQVLHLRFNKQAAFLGKIVLTEDSDAISVKIKIVTYPKNRNSAIKEARELFDKKIL